MTFRDFVIERPDCSAGREGIKKGGIILIKGVASLLCVNFSRQFSAVHTDMSVHTDKEA